MDSTNASDGSERHDEEAERREQSKEEEDFLNLWKNARPLALDFEPGPYDVICQRGKQAAYHIGNQNFRKMIRAVLPRYSKAVHKWEKSGIVTAIVRKTKDLSPEGGFIRRRGSRWYDVGDQASREKVGQTLRDQLHEKYRSSTKAKARRKKSDDPVSGDLPDQRSRHGVKSPVTTDEMILAQEASMKPKLSVASAEKIVEEYAAQDLVHISGSTTQQKTYSEMDKDYADKNCQYYRNAIQEWGRPKEKLSRESLASKLHVRGTEEKSRPLSPQGVAFAEKTSATSHNKPDSWTAKFRLEAAASKPISIAAASAAGQIEKDLELALDALFPPPDVETLHKLSIIEFEILLRGI